MWEDSHNDLKNKETGRMYVYSDENKLVDWRCVERHAAAARKWGFEVRIEKLNGRRTC